MRVVLHVDMGVEPPDWFQELKSGKSNGIWVALKCTDGKEVRGWAWKARGDLHIQVLSRRVYSIQLETFEEIL